MKDNRIKDLNILIEKLDISQSMVENATEKYKNISKYLASKGIDADIYPQGSFAIGTVVRPHQDSSNKNYDLDFVCKIKSNKNHYSTKELKHMVGNALKDSGTYSEKLESEWDRCWTLVYADVNDIGFSMDIVPAVDEDEDQKNHLRLETLNPHLLDTAIALTQKNGSQYSWLTNNPKGYQDWFNTINTKIVESQIRKYNHDNRTFYNSIEDIPENIGRTSLQKVIQILKRHRDVYFIKRNLENEKPISAIITTLVANIADSVPTSNMNILELLDYVTEELMIYSNQTHIPELEFRSRFPHKRLIQKVNGEWILRNPANPKDNLIDSWNSSSINTIRFFEWIDVVKKDFVSSFHEEDEMFLRGLENGLGSHFVRSSIPVHRYSTKTPSTVVHAAKPWRADNEARR
ncbi:nucleotidyltransferase domain-containing protein [Aerococcus urinaeequi]|uniref:nucleotidyltransferase domain-containing protein n=1 Tax=Aerococcus urinaeequi TaxID=51665 RepID=UPI003D6AE60B